ncbi:hypothetical protein ACLFMI_20090 [Pseudonocardia nantongensis]|uniref:hypothetical protein n=1 Tax=Pseudonocardia nantongensis TaxID=1181885 RepID=UPI00397B3BA0
MSTQLHDPQVLPISDVADQWVARCDCGCGLFEKFARRDDADAAASAAADDGTAPTATEHGVDHTDVLGGGSEPI